MRKFTKVFIVGVAILVMQIATQGQTTTGSLTGTVTDPGNAVVGGASVTVTNVTTGAERTGVTNSSGGFDFQTLLPGTYTISVEASGFKKAIVRDVIVSVAQTAQLTIPLEIGLANETVTVTTTQEVINSTSPSLTNVINTRQVVDLPLGGRNPVELAALQAGIAVIGTDTRGASVGGLRQTAVNLTQDGINAMDNFVKTSSFFAITTPSLNSTQEFSITTGTVGSDAGRGAAQVNLVTKGGTNDFHGGAFLQLINESYNANTFFNNFNGTVRPILRQHFYGGDIGGPVYFPRFGEGGPSVYSGKDRAFFFFSYEAFRQSQGRANNRNGVLTAEAKNGIFRYVGTNGALQTVNLLTIGSVHTLNPVMTAHLAQIPAANNFNCTNSDGFNIGCYTFNVSESNVNDKYVFRYDHELAKDTGLGSHKLELVYSRVVTSTHPDVFTNGIDAPFPGGVNGFQASTRNLITPALVSTFGSRWTNVVRYGRQWAPVDFNRDTQPSAPFISLPGVLVNFDNTFMPQPRNTIVNQVTDNLSWTSGNHLWRFGADWQNVLGISRNDAGINQTIQLGTNAANGAGFALANLPFGSNANLTAATTTYAAIVGNLQSSSRTLNVTSPDSGFVPGATRLRLVQEKDLALFAQDQWRMRSNLTLNYGVRWDYMGVPTVPNGLAIQPQYSDLYGVSGFGNLFKPTATAGTQTTPGATLKFVSGDTGIGLYNNDWNNFAPFLGFAYSPAFKSGPLHFLFGDEGSSSLRGGYSVSYLHDGVTTFTNLLGVGTTNPGLIASANLSVLSNTNPHTSNLVGVLGPGGVPLDLPTFKIPITDRENFLLNSANGLWTVDPNLRSPYVHQFSFGFEREIFKDTALEIRYSGNRAPNTWRAQDINEINIFENGFLQEFINAQKNLAARGGTSFAPGCAGCVATPILDRFFGVAGTGGTAVAASSGYSSTTFISQLTANNVGNMASTLAFNSAYRTNRESAAVGLPANFFVANPNAAFARVLLNDARSNYNALEIEVRRRFSKGLQFQADYTWSKAMGDAVDAQGNNQSDLVPRLTLRNPDLDYRRSTQDQTQRFVANGIYDLPFGRGRSYLSGVNGIVDKVVGGWTMGLITVWSTSPPFFISAGRSTFNCTAPQVNGVCPTPNNGAQLVGINFEEFKKNVGLFFDKGGVFFVNPAILDITYNAAGKVATSKLKPGLMTAPAPGTFGNFPVNSLSGPNYFNLDISVTKRIPITERVKFEVKVTAINILNHANFVFPGNNVSNQNFDSTTFGLITTQRGTARNINFIGQLRF
jgi:hypothetical protein